jgi:hypothetical protein
MLIQSYRSVARLWRASVRSSDREILDSGEPTGRRAIAIPVLQHARDLASGLEIGHRLFGVRHLLAQPVYALVKPSHEHPRSIAITVRIIARGLAPSQPALGSFSGPSA